MTYAIVVTLVLSLMTGAFMGGYVVASVQHQMLVEVASDLNTRTEAMLKETCLKEYAI